MAGDRTIFDEPHHQSLEFLAARALADGNIAEAFKFADRRCRILPLPEPHCYILRAEAFHAMGVKKAEIDDLLKALEIDPDNIAANRRMLAWGRGPQQVRAANSLIAHERNFDTLGNAIKILQAEGKRNFASATIRDDAIEGWAVWEDMAPLEISIGDGIHAITALFEADAFHPLGNCGFATSFFVSRPRSANPQSILVTVLGSTLYSARAASNDAKPMVQIRPPQPGNAPNPQITVIVPVYGDYDATRICLTTLLDELNSYHHRAILVDDATPDARIAQYLTELRTESRIDVLINARNLGFVGTVNRALEHIKQGDVILLNADTIVPPGFINRLAAAAQSSPNIGTVTPLSNNGEFTSFPIPYRANPLCSREEIQRIDTIAARLNSEWIIDIPSGIGFCLYITRPCLDAVGYLSEDFGLGYFEDTDFCLRARELGFRNVCAPSVYVGHAGSKSFGQKKRSLVVRNLSVLERRFPKHSAECGAFMAADPIRAPRMTIEREAADLESHPRLLVAGAGIVGTTARHRGKELASEAKPVMIFEVRFRGDGAWLAVINPTGGIPQSLQFNLNSSTERKSLIDFTESLQPSRIEFLDPANVPLQLVNLLLRLKVPYDIFVADAGLLGRHNEQVYPAATRCNGLEITASHKTAHRTSTERDNRLWMDRWREIAENAEQILVPNATADAFIKTILPRRTITETVLSTQATAPRNAKSPKNERLSPCVAAGATRCE